MAVTEGVLNCVSPHPHPNIFNPHLKICLLILEREEGREAWGGGREGGRERERERERDGTHNLVMCPDQ